MERVLDEVEVLLPVLGFDVLRPAGQETVAKGIARPSQPEYAFSAPVQSDIFTFTESGTSARAREANDEFVVLEGSLARSSELQVVQSASIVAVNNSLLTGEWFRL